MNSTQLTALSWLFHHFGAYAVCTGHGGRKYQAAQQSFCAECVDDLVNLYQRAETSGYRQAVREQAMAEKA